MSNVRNNAATHRFELDLDGVIAFVTYRREGDAISLNHTEVPPALSGRGVGSTLAQGTLDLIRADGMKVIPRCAFIAAFIEKHPEYRDLVQ